MSGYDEVEHGVSEEAKPTTSSRRPDMSSYYALADRVIPPPSTTTQQNNSNAIPEPEQVAAMFQLMGEMITTMASDNGPTTATELMMSVIHEGMLNPPTQVNGMSEEFLADLERIPKSKLKKDWDCPICGLPFLDDPYPLVVRLPCHKSHMFDLDCIRPWLKINTTCPLDRKDLKPKPTKKPVPPPADEDEEDDYNGLYG